MLVTDKIPQHIYDILRGRGFDVDGVMLATYCDMNDEHIFCDTYIFSTEKQIAVISGTVGFNNSCGKRGGLQKIWNETAYKTLEVEDIENLKLEELMSGARLTAKHKSGEYSFLTAMTNTCRASVLLFIKYFERMKKGELSGVDFTIDPEDDPAENRCPKCGMRYPDKNRKICPKCMEKGKLYKRFASFLFKYKKYIAIMFLSLVMLTAAGILAPYFSNEFFYDEVLDKNGGFFGEILLVIGLIIGTRVLSQIFNVINGRISAKISAKITYDLKMTVFKSIEKLSLSFFSGRQTGGLMTQVNNDSNTIYYFFCDGIPYFLINIIQVVVV